MSIQALLQEAVPEGVLKKKASNAKDMKHICAFSVFIL